MQSKETHTKDIDFDSVRLGISGMRCASCSASIENELRKKDGIQEANVYILNNTAVIKFNKEQCDIDSIISCIESLGFKATPASKPTFSLANNTSISNNSNQIKGSFTLKPPHADSVNKISFQNSASIDTLQNTKIPNSTKTTNTESTKITEKTTQNTQKNLFQRLNNYVEHTLLNDKRRLSLSIILSLIILYLSMLHDMFNLPLPQVLYNSVYNGMIQLFITLCVMHFGRNIYFHGLKALFTLRPNMDSLVSVGSLSGFLYSCFSLYQMWNTSNTNHLYFESVCIILSFVMLGKFMEENAKNKAIKNAKALLQRQSNVALKIINTQALYLDNNDALEVKEVSPYDLKIGDYIRILPHSFIPIDSTLYSVEASVDESMLSGESIPIRKEKTEQLFAGTLNLDTPIIACVSHTLKDSKISKMQTLLEQTLESKAQIAKLADRISLIFVPVVMLLAICSGIFWFIFEGLESAMLYFASTLLISCPCALGLATPMAILFANARANTLGIFFKNAQSLENLSKADYIVFDKTGTLTQRDFHLHKIILKNKESNIDEKELLHLAASIEVSSNHIIARAICNSFEDTGLYKQIESKQYMNAGIESKLLIDSKERMFLIGNAKLLKDRAGFVVTEEFIEGCVCVYIAEIVQNEVILLGHIYLAETLKPHAQEMIQELQKSGFNCEILSGDTKENVGYIAKMLQIPYQAECLPEDKMRYIETLQNQGHKVIMVGDGVNDSIAIAKADISLVMASGSEVSIEYGHIVYFRDDLLGIVEALQLGKRTLKNIKQNLGFAFIYNIICIPIAMGLFSSFGIALNPMFASLAMSLSSISVVGNASRLYRVK
ncbi:MAG: heavy metal translocating P-type ATPase [Helicobacter trogontum]|uniref:heavy metal translocating P-type ATPase n=1 Tax=Helicobacter trogontum TaxID=50960 RepID=UPI00242FC8EC|nr:heavy metal translocating P-type ATPase [Helicobacter trogontum]MCI5786997.1 heavy metal translocating P-type ATPase [Helicobacter trogontum]